MSENKPSVNAIHPLVIYEPVLAEPRVATGIVLTNATAQHVAIVDGSGNQVTSFGGGTQYTEGDTDASITGTAMMMEGAGNALVVAQGTASDGLLVNLGSNNDVTVTGSVTANAGTNLNTSALALETTATSIKTAVETIDNAISGSEMQVDVLTVPSDPFGANADAASATGSISAKLRFIAATGIPITGTVAVTQSTSPWIVAGGGSAGTAATGVVTVQGIASMTPVQVSQATASNLNATVVQATGSNLHTVIDSGTITTVSTVSSISAVIPGTGATNLGKAIDSPTGATDTGVLLLATRDDGLSTLTPAETDNVQLRVDSVGALWVNGSAFTQPTTAVGTIADDATTPGAPVMIGGMAKSPDGTDPGSVSAENDVFRAFGDLNRRLFVNTHHPRSVYKHLDGSTAYTDESVFADPGDGFQTVITSIIVSTGAATAMNFFLEEGSTKIFGPVYLEAVAGRGFVSGPIYLPITASTAVTVTTSASIAQSLHFDGYIQAV